MVVICQDMCLMQKLILREIKVIFYFIYFMERKYEYVTNNIGKVNCTSDYQIIEIHIGKFIYKGKTQLDHCYC